MLNQLPKIKSKASKRLGRGLGSTKGKTAGRGTKGQKARGKIPVGFSGSGLPLYKKLPLRRGWGNTRLGEKMTVLNLSDLANFKTRGVSGTKTVIDIEKLIEAKLINRKDAKRGVKILAGGEVASALTIKLPVSENARKKIVKIGGKVLNV